MSEVKFGTIGGIEPSKIQKIKLNVMDYIFNYKGIDLNRAYLEYYFDKMKTVNYKDGIKQEEKYTPIIFFDITAQLNNKEYSFSFALEMGLEQLNNLGNKPTNINNYINQGEIFFSEDIDLNFYLNENPYTFQPSYVVTKLEKNKFVFKVQYQLLFIWFVVKFNEA